MTEEINLAFDACKKAHKAWIDAGSVVTVPKSEGKLPKGRPVKEDAIATDIASGLAEDKIIEREVQRVKAARFKKGMSLSPEERKKIEDRVKKRVRSRRKTKNS
jgi:acyl-CoA reductase-like NAD-dependent aldehyde dehydrogenase